MVPCGIREAAAMQLNLPNALTMVRIFLVPLLVVVLLTPPASTVRVSERVDEGWLAASVAWLSDWREIVAVVIFLTAAATDFLDGWLARTRGQVTALGQLLDPMADKLLTNSAFISLVELGLAPAWMVVVIVGRDFVVSGMRSIAASRGLVIAARRWGKYKTVSQIVAIPLLILTAPLEHWTPYLGLAALWVSLILAIVSMVDYSILFVKTVDLRS